MASEFEWVSAAGEAADAEEKPPLRGAGFRQSFAWLISEIGARPVAGRVLLLALTVALTILPHRAGDAEVGLRRASTEAGINVTSAALMPASTGEIASPPATEVEKDRREGRRRFSETDRACLATAIYHEARGETADGQIAVAQVVLNRAASDQWPSTICDVVYQGSERKTGCQFSFACAKRKKTPDPADKHWLGALAIVEAVEDGALLPAMSVATHYHTTTVRPVWRLRLQKIGQIGRHVFYAGPRHEIRRSRPKESAAVNAGGG